MIINVAVYSQANQAVSSEQGFTREATGWIKGRAIQAFFEGRNRADSIRLHHHPADLPQVAGLIHRH